MSLRNTVRQILLEERPMTVGELLRQEQVRRLTRQASRVANVLSALTRDGEVVFRPDGRYGPPGMAVRQLGDKCMVLSRFEAFARKKGEAEIADVLAEIRGDLGILSVRRIA